MIRLQFVGEDCFTSNTIAWFSQGHLSHVDALLDDGTLLGARSDVVGGKPPGVQIRPAHYVKFAQCVRFTLSATAEQEAAWLMFLHSQIGKPYDKTAIWAFAFNRNWREKDSWICSELQAAALEKASVCPDLYLAANKITPVALALTVSALRATPELVLTGL